MKRIMAMVLLLTIVLFSHLVKSIDVSSVDISVESDDYRCCLAITVIQLIPDDKLKQKFVAQDYLIMEYAKKPKEFEDPQSHNGSYLLDNIMYGYESLIDAMNYGNWTLIAMRYGVLSHWVGDASDPFNVVSVNQTTIEHMRVYEQFIDIWSDDIFEGILDKYKAQIEEEKNITRAIEELINNAKRKFASVVTAINNNDTAMLLHISETLASEAVKVLYTIVMNAIKNSELAKSHRVLQRWYIVAIAMIGLSAIIIGWGEIKKRTVRRV